MTIPQISDVQPVLRDFELRIRRVLEEAWSLDWMSMSLGHRSKLSKRSRASCMFDFAKHRAVQEFTGDSDIQIRPAGQTVKFLFRGSVLMRIKKANSKGLGSNIETQAVLQFVNPQIQMFNLPPIYHIEVCYEEDSFAQRLSSITVNYRQLYRRLWSYELARPIAAQIVPMRVDGASEDNAGTGVEVRPRIQADAKDEQE